MKKICLLLMSLSVCSNIYAADVQKSNIAVDTIQIGKMDGDLLDNQASIVINLKNNGKEVKTWQFGFYMPRSFATMAASGVNPELKMQICEAGGGCVNLRYVKSADISQNDLSQGYLTILEPMETYPLQHKKSYYIKLAHSNFGVVKGVSELPQSLFLINKADAKDYPSKIYTINTELTNYEVIGYNQNQVSDDIINRTNQNWESSQILQDTQPAVSIVPNPVNIMTGFGDKYVFPTKTLVIHNQFNTDNSVAEFWSTVLKSDWKIKGNVTIDNDENATTGIMLQTMSDPRSINNNPEGYRLMVDQDGIIIQALTTTGFYYGLQTLRQISYRSGGTLPSVIITDYPRFKYRGVLLDVARHYFSVDEIKRVIDVMASQKLNTLHLHLSDDEAFRIALSDYPSLNSIGATRGLGLSIGPNMLLQNNLDTANLTQYDYAVANTVYSGIYTALDIKTIVDYANQNQITVIPEIDIPGHARSLIKSLPNAMVDPDDNSQYISVQGYTDDVLPVCTYGTDISVGNQFTTTTNNIVTSIAQMFDNQTTIYANNNEISVGGDEVSHHAWSNSTSCRDEWSNLDALGKSHLFFAKLAESNPNLLISGWQQMVQTESVTLGQNVVPSTQTGHIWVWNPSVYGIKQAAKLANSGYPTVLAYADKTYFDLKYTPELTEQGFSWAGKFNDTYNVLSSSNTANITLQQSQNPQNILGLEGALWSENIPSFDHLMYMALPKLPALAEASWSSQYSVTKNNQLNWQDFSRRLGCGDSGYLEYLHQVYGVNYRGYPNGIHKEIPENTLCSAKSDEVPYK